MLSLSSSAISRAVEAGSREIQLTRGSTRVAQTVDGRTARVRALTDYAFRLVEEAMRKRGLKRE